MRRFFVLAVLALVSVLSLVAVAGCGEAVPTPTPTPTLIAHPTPTVATAQVAPTASRQEVYEALDSLNLGLLPLDRQGMDDWWSTRLPNADITIDIFGPPDRVEAVEVWFRHGAPASRNIPLLVEALVATIIPEQEAQSMSWFRDSLESIEQTGEQKQQTSEGAMYLTLQWVENLNQYFFSIDEERR